MCRAIDEIKDEVAIQIAIEFIKNGSVPYEEIAKCCRLTLEEVQEIAAEINAPA